MAIGRVPMLWFRLRPFLNFPVLGAVIQANSHMQLLADAQARLKRVRSTHTHFIAGPCLLGNLGGSLGEYWGVLGSLKLAVFLGPPSRH